MIISLCTSSGQDNIVLFVAEQVARHDCCPPRWKYTLMDVNTGVMGSFWFCDCSHVITGVTQSRTDHINVVGIITINRL